MGSSSSGTPSLFGCIFICAILAAHFVVIASASAFDFSGGHQLGDLSSSTRSAAGGLIADEDEDAEKQMDTVPCSRRGASYYNCRPGAQANPYSRGCSSITRCRSSITCCRHRSPANPYRLGCSAVTRCRR